MSVIIKDMNVPERCFDCDFYDEGYCKAQKEFMPFAVFGNYKDKDCPLIEVINCKDYINFLNNRVSTELLKQNPKIFVVMEK